MIIFILLSLHLSSDQYYRKWELWELCLSPLTHKRQEMICPMSCVLLCVVWCCRIYLELCVQSCHCYISLLFSLINWVYHILYNGTNWLSSILQPLLLPLLCEMQSANPTIWLFDKMVLLVCVVQQHATCSSITQPLPFIWNILDNDLQYVPPARSYTCCTF